MIPLMDRARLRPEVAWAQDALLKMKKNSVVSVESRGGRS